MNVLAVYNYYYATGSQNKHLILIDCVCFQSLSLIHILIIEYPRNSEVSIIIQKQKKPSVSQMPAVWAVQKDCEIV